MRWRLQDPNAQCQGRTPTKPEDPIPSGGTLEIDHRIRLSGELTQATVRDFEKAIRAAVEAAPREVEVDLTAIEHIDETGLTALLKAHLRSRRHGLPLKFVPAEHEAVRQVVAITGTDAISD